MSGAVAGFVQGLFQGADWREGRDERARKRKIEDEMMGWERQRFGWETEDAAYNRKTRAMELQKAQQAADDDAARRKLGRDFAAEMDRESQAQQSPISAPEPAQNVRIPASSVPFGAPGQTGSRGLGFSILGDAVQGGAGQTAMRGDPGVDRLDILRESGQAGMPQSSRDAMNVAPPPYHGPPQTGPAIPVPMRGPAFEDGGRAPSIPPSMSILDAAVASAQRNAEGRVTSPRVLQGGRGERSDILAQAANASMPQTAREAFNAKEAGVPSVPSFENTGRRDRTSAERRAIATRDAARDFFSGLVPDLSGVAAPGDAMRTFGAAVGSPVSSRAKDAAGVLASAAGATGIGASAFQAAENDRSRADTVLSSKTQNSRSRPTSAPPQPAAAQPAQPARKVEQQPAAQQSALSFGASRTSEGTPMASLSLGREMGLIGRDGPVKTTKAMTEKAGEQFERAYLREYAPKMARLYVEQGDPEKAKLWMEWINDKNVKEGLKAWAKAGHAFSVGDAEGFLDYLAESFNVQGYADNGYSVNRSKSNFTHADNGDILGAQITWIDNATGREFTQNIEGINDLMAVGWGMLAPEKQFELGWEATLGAKKVKPKSIDPAKLMEAIEDRKLSDPEFANLTSDEQEAIMVQAFQRIALGSLGAGVSGTANNPVNPFD